jgi:hypothetical protein
MRLGTYYTTTATIFTIIGILHGVRLIQGWPATVAGVQIPLWISGAAVVIAIYLAARGFYFRSKCS